MSTSDAKKPTQLRRQEEREARRREAIERSQIARRHRETSWPLDATTLEHSDLVEPGDVRMPTPPDPPPLSEYRKRAIEQTAPTATDIEAERTVVINRYHERQRERERDNALRGTIWTPEIVDQRIARAFEVSLTWKKGGPRQFGSMMPKTITQLSDLVAQAENQELKKHLSRLLRRRVHWTAQDEQLAADAIGWTTDYLADQTDDEIARFVNLGGFWRATRVKVRRACELYDIWPATYYRKRKIGLELIVDGLIADKRAPI